MDVLRNQLFHSHLYQCGIDLETPDAVASLTKSNVQVNDSEIGDEAVVVQLYLQFPTDLTQAMRGLPCAPFLISRRPIFLPVKYQMMTFN
jgi:hypothetical protein